MRLTLTQQRKITWPLFLAYAIYTIGCARFYKPVAITTAAPQDKAATLKKLNDDSKYFIIRKNATGYGLRDVVLDQTNMTITGLVEELAPQHQLYLKDQPGGKKGSRPRYSYSRYKNQQVVMQEVHLFTSDTAAVKVGETQSFSLFDIRKLELIQFDKNKTTRHNVTTAVVATLGVTLIVYLIAAASDKPDPQPVGTGSCPYISGFDGEAYQLAGEIYSSSIYPSLQREDWLRVPVKNTAGFYKIQISNELQEIQHTDLAALLVVTHEPGTKAMADPQGQVHIVREETRPSQALLDDQRDVGFLLREKDNRSVLFNGENKRTDAPEEVTLTFRNPGRASTGNLILHTKSSSWLTYVFGEFAKGFGNYYASWTRQQEKRPAAELEKWMKEQHIPLSVSIKTANGWKKLNEVKSIGPLLHREVVIPVEFGAAETVELKLSAGYLFWELDYAAMDFSKETGFSVQHISPARATNEKGENVLPQLTSADKNYLVQPSVGDVTEVLYEAPPPVPGKLQTVFLHSSGYYSYIRHYSGTAKKTFLKSFEKPGALSAFSRQKFREAWGAGQTAKN